MGLPDLGTVPSASKVLAAPSSLVSCLPSCFLPLFSSIQIPIALFASSIVGFALSFAILWILLLISFSCFSLTPVKSYFRA